jgi:tetratricopeptide (TPR) repeat protein
MMPFLRKPSTWLRQHSRSVLLALILTLSAIGAAVLVGWPRYQLHAAEQALHRYAFDDAQQHMDRYFKIRSGDAAAHLLAAQIARRRDDYTGAEKHLAAALQQPGMTESISLERMLLTAQQGNFESAERSLWGRTGPEYPEAVVVLEALAKGYVNHYRQAQELYCLNLLLERDPNHPYALLARARAWEDRAAHGEKEREEDALRDYEKAVELYPTFDARLGLAGTLYRVGRVHDAAYQFEQLYAEHPEHTEVIFGLARCRYSLHQVSEAKQLFRKVLDAQPEHAGALLDLGSVLVHEGKLAGAESVLQRAVACSPRFRPEPLRVLSRCLEAAGKSAEAGRIADELKKRDAEVIEVERMSSRAAKDPRNVALRYEVAVKLTALGREHDGAAALLSAIDLDPRHGPAHESLANYFERQGQTDRAELHRRMAAANAETGTGIK